MKDISDDRVATVVGEENVSIVESIEYPEVIVDKHLSWEEKISAGTNKFQQ